MRFILVSLLLFSCFSFATNLRITDLPDLFEANYADNDVIVIVDRSLNSTRKTTLDQLDLRWFNFDDDGPLGTEYGGLGVDASALTGVLRIDSGSVSVATVDIASGGTGQTTAQEAIDALLPDQTGNAQQSLTTDGTNASWTNTGLLDIEYFTASGTYTKNPDARIIRVFVVGGGGGGGGVDGQGSSTFGAGGGGGGGETCTSVILNSAVGATETVTIGAGGTGTSGDVNGGDGGTSSFGALVTAAGGSGGLSITAGTNQATRNGGAGGSGGTGDFCFRGQQGGFGVFMGNSTSDSQSGMGGSAGYFSGGGGTTRTGDNDGIDGEKGAGGSGANVNNVSTNFAGGAGGAGYVIVEEYR